ncbi:MAG TPA: exodeoxyribonuclease VII large subunit [bacterium]|nr:exodeoxyribonuclease VII large subunit [bacterium]
MRAPPGREVMSVSQLTAKIIASLEKSFPAVWVQGEVGDFVGHSSGHWYFNLKDDKAQLRAVMFKFVNRLLRFKPEEGMEVLCRGRVSGYAPRGVYQLNVEWMEPRGLGALYLEFEQLKEKLGKEGLFDPARKRPIPSPLKRIAIITSGDGAALQDMLRILRERDPGIEVLIVPSAVQGPGAAQELARAVELANRPGIAAPPDRRPLEAIVIGRGGGSLEDLWAFNDEVLARAIAASRIPVISAVGHEVDFTIADFVADLRAPTPTAAAEIVAAGREQRGQLLGHQLHRMRSAVARRYEDAAFALDSLGSRLRDPGRAVLDLMMRADELHERTRRAMLAAARIGARAVEAQGRALKAHDPRTRHLLMAARLDGLGSRITSAGMARAQRGYHRLETSGARLSALSPESTLARGFSITRDAAGRVVRDASAVAVGDDLELVLWRGGLDTTVKKIREGGKGNG